MTMKPSWTAPTGRRTARRLLLALAAGVSVATTALAVDKPLGTFGLDDGAGRGIGYQKAASVFHMLEEKIGREPITPRVRRR